MSVVLSIVKNSKLKFSKSTLVPVKIALTVNLPSEGIFKIGVSVSINCPVPLTSKVVKKAPWIPTKPSCLRISVNGFFDKILNPTLLIS